MIEAAFLAAPRHRAVTRTRGEEHAGTAAAPYARHNQTRGMRVLQGLGARSAPRLGAGRLLRPKPQPLAARGLGSASTGRNRCPATLKYNELEQGVPQDGLRGNVPEENALRVLESITMVEEKLSEMRSVRCPTPVSVGTGQGWRAEASHVGCVARFPVCGLGGMRGCDCCPDRS